MTPSIEDAGRSLKSLRRLSVNLVALAPINGYHKHHHLLINDLIDQSGSEPSRLASTLGFSRTSASFFLNC